MNPETIIEETLSPETDVQPTDEPTDEPTASSGAADNASTDALLQEHLDYNRRLLDLRKKVVQCERNVEDCKEELKVAKEELDLAHKAIDKLIDDFNCEMPLFDNPPDSPDASNASDLPDDAGEAEPPADASKNSEDTSWMTVSLHDLPIPWAKATALEEAGICTVGDLSAWTESGKLLTDVAGIGEKAAERIKAALDEFWRSRQ